MFNETKNYSYRNDISKFLISDLKRTIKVHKKAFLVRTNAGF